MDVCVKKKLKLDFIHWELIWSQKVVSIGGLMEGVEK